MRIFLIADPHFGHPNIIEYENRPFLSVEDMTEKMIKNWNEKVGKNDKVFVVGDFSMYGKEKTKEIVERLHGYKILIMGNHDREHSVKWWLDVGFNEVSKYPIIYDEWIVMQHEPPTYYNDATPYFYIYGHVHSSEMYKTITKQTACVCVERWGYAPVELSEIKKLVMLL